MTTPSPRVSNKGRFKSGRVNVQPSSQKDNKKEQKSQQNDSNATKTTTPLVMGANKEKSSIELLAEKAIVELSPSKLSSPKQSPAGAPHKPDPIVSNVAAAPNQKSANTQTTIIAPPIRPEILLLTPFKPLYKKVSGGEVTTPEGEIFNLFISQLQLNESKANQLLDKKFVSENNEKLKFEIGVLRNNLQDLSEFIKTVSTLKSGLDVSNNPSYKFKPGQFIEKSLSFSTIPTTKTFKNVDLNSSIDLKESLGQARGLGSGAIPGFASTKLFLTSLQELNALIQTFPISLSKDFLSSNLNFLNLSGKNSDIKNKLPAVWKKPKEKSDIATSRFDVGFFTGNQDETVDYKGVDFDSTGEARFSSLWPDLDFPLPESNDKDFVKISFIFYMCFKDLIQKTRFELHGKSSKLVDRKAYFDSFIGFYKENNTFDQISTDIDPGNTFFGNKLSDLSFYGSLEDKTKRVLVLENYPSTNLSNKSVQTGEEYLFAAGNLEQFFTNQVYNLERIKDFKNFLDKMADASFTNFIDLGVLPPDDSYVSSLGKHYSTLNPINAFKELQGKLLDSLTDYSNIQFMPGITTDNQLINVFTEIDLISLFCFEKRVTVLGTNNSVQFGTQMTNWFYNYVYSVASGENTVSETQIGDFVRYLLFAMTTSAEVSDDRKDLDKVIRVPQDLNALTNLIASSIKNSKFISVIIDFFKKYIDLGNLLPAIFLAIRELIKKVNRVTFKMFKDYTQNYGLIFDYSKLIDSYVSTGSNVDSVKVNTGLNKKKKDYSVMLDNVATRIDFYSKNATLLTFGVVNTIQTLTNNVKSIFDQLSNFDKNISEYLLRYLDNDQTRLSALFKESQLQLLLSTIEDLYQSYDGFSVENVDSSQLFVKREDNISHSTIVVELLKNYFKNDEFLFEKGYNKQIISVGIPRELFKSFNTFLKDKKSNNKSDDVFKILIYKVDLLNPYLVYRPKSFLFEASRFPVRIYSELKKVGTTYDLVPTRNYSLYSSDDIEKFKFGVIGHNVDDSFGDEYNGWSPQLTLEDKKLILANQTTSFLLENYLKIISGFNVSELTFNDIPMVDANKKLSNLLMSNDVFNPAMSESVRDLFSKSNLSAAATKAIPNPDLYISKLIQPKKFDRVFNIIFDPEFELDYDATQKGLNGAGYPTLFQSYVDSAKLKQNIKNNNYSYVDSNKDLNSIELNSYFVTVESHSTYDDGTNTQSVNDLKLSKFILPSADSIIASLKKSSSNVKSPGV
jgi:hypothetical protein